MQYLFLFDIDGTILRLKQYKSRKVFQKALKHLHSVDVPIELMPDFSGMTDLQILKDICSVVDYSFDKVKSNIDLMWDYLINEFKAETNSESIILMPAIRETLEYLSTFDNVKIALVTGNFRSNAYLKLQAHNLENYFPVGAFGSDFENRDLLPPLAIDRAKQYWLGNKFSTQKTIIIGDSYKDVLCAKANNIFSVAVMTGFSDYDELNSYNPNLIYPDLTDYKGIISKIFNIL
jgi:phosphoglycolate phosphatase